MSLKINWDLLGFDDDLAIQEWIGERFASLTKSLPPYIGKIEVQDFQIGRKPPSVEILEISDAPPNFFNEKESKENEERSPLDIMMKIKLNWDSKCKLVLKTSVGLNWITDNFLSLPSVIVTLSDIKLEAEVILLTYSDGRTYLTIKKSDELGPIKKMKISTKAGNESKQSAPKGIEKVEECLVDQLRLIIESSIIFPKSIELSKKKTEK